MKKKQTLVDRYVTELVRVPGMASCAVSRGDLYVAAKDAHGQFYANCALANAQAADAGAQVLSRAQIAAFMAGETPEAVLAMGAA